MGLRVWALTAVAGLLACARPELPERIVLIVIDTLRRDHLSAYGGPVATPGIDALAERGAVFTRSLASFHQTSMSMGALFTGRTPSIESRDARRTLVWNGTSWCGMARFAEGDAEGSCVPAVLPTLAERLSEAGYWTVGIASNELLYEPSGFSAGFDDWVEVGRKARLPAAGKANWRVVDGTRVNRAALEALKRRPADRFFLYVHYMDVHDYLFRQQSYAEAVASVDAAVGALLGHLGRAGLLERASVILTSDHGENLGERHGSKHSAYHIGNPSFAEVLEVPLIVAPAPSADVDALVRTQDLYGLILRIAGLEPGEPSELEPDELYVGEKNYRTYLRGRWKSTMRRDSGRFHLYDLKGDPGETRDVADAHPDVIREHLVRAAELSKRLRTERASERPLSERDRQRLRALGYLD